jgi:hypothetical protein
MNEYGDLASWTSSVIGQLVYYERSYIYEDAGEVLFVQMRMSEHQRTVYPGLQAFAALANVQQVSPLLRGGLQSQQFQHPGHMQEYP